MYHLAVQLLFQGIDAHDLLFHAGNLAVVLGIGWKVNRVANRILDVLADFPPHRHVNGKISYPKGYEPAAVETLVTK